MAEPTEMSRSFGAAAAAYETGRPDYPAEAVAWLLQPVDANARGIRVADVGAGTGKLTRVLAALGAEPIAVDPDPLMLETLRARGGGVPTFEGTAESLPLAGASLDAVVLGQAWHWVDSGRASAEIARVLRPGGVLGLIWNIRDVRTPWVSRLGEIMHSSNAERMLDEGGPALSSPFGDPERETWEWTNRVTRAKILAMVTSRSYVITASAAERARIECEVGTLCDEIGAVDDAEVDLPYTTRAFRAVRP